MPLNLFYLLYLTFVFILYATDITNRPFWLLSKQSRMTWRLLVQIRGSVFQGGIAQIENDHLMLAAGKFQGNAVATLTVIPKLATLNDSSFCSLFYL